MKPVLKYTDADTLVCLVKSRNDFSILKDQLWYRIPVRSFIRVIREFKFTSFDYTSVFKYEKYE